MIVENESNSRFRRVVGVDLAKKLDEFAAPMSLGHKAVHVSVQQINSGQQRYRAVAHVFVVAQPHLSKETRSFLATRPNRFEFIFTPTHGSWLNLIESFFAKMAKIFLRGLQVSSKKELKQRLEQYLKRDQRNPGGFPLEVWPGILDRSIVSLL